MNVTDRGAVAAAEWLPAGAAVVLELGAGLASGAVALLEEIEARGRLGDVRGYRFTEPVSAFLRRGEQTLRARICINLEVNRPPSSVPECIANDLGYGGCEPCLFRGIEFEKARDLRGALACRDDVLIVGEAERKKAVHSPRIRGS